ncbi:MAG: hypothetical protein A2Z24_00620 [Candidatus Woykebacteria bacterium RBG_16_44_10]|uniref:PIN domain-containing protein n=1 Tax=Candidatus Woykebacteria bacterium RBG_16_44_10 TaxID=1802597 RepID=A0A1G1WCA8_9BACT|nr:MAG: hypothetical protein A2Z24_00620 [Candidatus Woykebacteria bacterium RBG_16_44_10]
MLEFLVDTDIWVDFFHDQKYARDLINKISIHGPVFTSILSITELRTGFTQEQAEFYLPRFYNITGIVQVSKSAALLAGKFRWEFRRRGITIPTVDSIIAATTIENNYQLVTRNKKDFPMPEIKFYEF